MPILSDISRRKKIRHFLRPIPKNARVLEIGCGEGWVGEYLKKGGWSHYVGIDLTPPADIVGDIKQWSLLGLKPQDFDVVIAFEVIEHVPCLDECYDLLKPDGLLMMTSPLPRMDWVMKLLEALRLNQRRTSPHSNLTDFRAIPRFEPVQVQIVGGLAQWGIFRKPAQADSGTILKN